MQLLWPSRSMVLHVVAWLAFVGLSQGGASPSANWQIGHRHKRETELQDNLTSIDDTVDLAAQISENTLWSQNTIYALQSLDAMSWDYYLLAAPLSVAYIGQIMALSFQSDVPFEASVAASLTSLKGSTGLRTAMVHINSQAVDTFAHVDSNMQRMRTQSGAIKSYVEDGLEDFEQNYATSLLAKLIKVNFALIDNAARECARFANDTSAAFGVVRQMVNDVIVGTATTEQQRRAAQLAMNDQLKINNVSEAQLREESASLAIEIEQAKAMVQNATESASKYREQAAVAPVFQEITQLSRQCRTKSWSFLFFGGSSTSCSDVPVRVSAPLPIQKATVYLPRLKKQTRGKANIQEMQAYAIAAGARDYLGELQGTLARIKEAASDGHVTPLNQSTGGRARRSAETSGTGDAGSVTDSAKSALDLNLKGGEVKFGEQIPLLTTIASIFPGAAPILGGFQKVLALFKGAANSLKGSLDNSVTQEITTNLQKELKAEMVKSFNEPAAKFDMSQTVPPDPEGARTEDTLTVYGVHAAIDAQAIRAEFDAAQARVQLDEAKSKLDANLAMLNNVALENTRIDLDLLTTAEIIELARNASIYLSYLQSSWLAMSTFFERISGYVYQMQETALREFNAYANCDAQQVAQNETGVPDDCVDILNAKSRHIAKIYQSQIWPNANVLNLASSLYLKASFGQILLPMSSLVGILNLREKADVPIAIGKIWDQYRSSLAKIHSYIKAQHATFANALTAVDGRVSASETAILQHTTTQDLSFLKQVANATVVREKEAKANPAGGFGGFFE